MTRLIRGKMRRCSTHRWCDPPAPRSRYTSTRLLMGHFSAVCDSIGHTMFIPLGCRPERIKESPGKIFCSV